MLALISTRMTLYNCPQVLNILAEAQPIKKFSLGRCRPSPIALGAYHRLTTAIIELPTLCNRANDVRQLVLSRLL